MYISGPLPIYNIEIKPVKKFGLAYILRGKLFSSSENFKILIIYNNFDLFLSPL